MSRIKNPLFHIILGYIFFLYPVLSTYYVIGILLIGTYFIAKKNDPVGKYPIIFSIYIVVMEVLLRMSGAKVFWEFGKYAIIYFMILGIFRKSSNKNKHKVKV